jgi:hypothetical protein
MLNTMQAYIISTMQVSVYVSETDYETLSGHKPAEFRTTSMFLADILRKKAEQERKGGAEGLPIIPKKEIVVGS